MCTGSDAWAILQHVPHEGPGLIALLGAGRGISFSTVRLDRGEPLPPAKSLGGLVILGGPMGVYEADRHPHLAAEIELIRGCVAFRRPVLGVCLGAQLIASALGGRVYRGDGPEVGAGDVELTDAGRADPVLGGGGSLIPVFHWHGDTFDIPENAVRFASSDACANQGFMMGNRIVGLQFHLETTPASARSLIRNCRDELDGSRFVQTEKEMLACGERFTLANELMGTLLRQMEEWNS